MSMPHLTDESKDGAHSVEIDRAYSAFMEHEVSLRFGQVPEGRRILPPHISGQYRIHGYHVKNDPHA